MRLGMPELLIVFALLLLLFGGSKLPALGSALGSAIRNFKKGFSDDGGDPKLNASTRGVAEDVHAAAPQKVASKE